MLRSLQVLESPPLGSPPFRRRLQGRAVGFAGSIQSREIISTIENQMKIKNDMEAGNIDWLESTDVQVSPAPDDYPSMPRSGAAQPKGQWQTAALASRQKPWLTSNYHPKGSQKNLGFQGGKVGWVERGGVGRLKDRELHVRLRQLQHMCCPCSANANAATLLSRLNHTCRGGLALAIKLW